MIPIKTDKVITGLMCIICIVIGILIGTLLGWTVCPEQKDCVCHSSNECPDLLCPDTEPISRLPPTQEDCINYLDTKILEHKQLETWKEK